MVLAAAYFGVLVQVCPWLTDEDILSLGTANRDVRQRVLPLLRSNPNPRCTGVLRQSRGYQSPYITRVVFRLDQESAPSVPAFLAHLRRLKGLLELSVWDVGLSIQGADERLRYAEGAHGHGMPVADWDWLSHLAAAFSECPWPQLRRLMLLCSWEGRLVADPTSPMQTEDSGSDAWALAQQEAAAVLVEAPVPLLGLLVSSLPPTLLRLHLGYRLPPRNLLDALSHMARGGLSNLQGLTYRGLVCGEPLRLLVSCLSHLPMLETLTLDTRPGDPEVDALLDHLHIHCPRLQALELFGWAIGTTPDLRDGHIFDRLMELIIDGKLPDYAILPLRYLPSNLTADESARAAQQIVQAFRLRRFLRLASLDLSWPFHPLPDALFRDLMASLPPLPLLESATLLIQAHRQGEALAHTAASLLDPSRYPLLQRVNLLFRGPPSLTDPAPLVSLLQAAVASERPRTRPVALQVHWPQKQAVPAYPPLAPLLAQCRTLWSQVCPPPSAPCLELILVAVNHACAERGACSATPASWQPPETTGVGLPLAAAQSPTSTGTEGHPTPSSTGAWDHATCDTTEGYLLFRPLPMVQAPHWLKSEEREDAPLPVPYLPWLAESHRGRDVVVIDQRLGRSPAFGVEVREKVLGYCLRSKQREALGPEEDNAAVVDDGVEDDE